MEGCSLLSINWKNPSEVIRYETLRKGSSEHTKSINHNRERWGSRLLPSRLGYIQGRKKPRGLGGVGKVIGADANRKV